MAQKLEPEASSKPLEKQQEPKSPFPVLPVRDTVLFPHAVLPLTVGRESSVQLINSLGEDKTIIVVAQREARVDAHKAAMALPRSHAIYDPVDVQKEYFHAAPWNETPQTLDLLY